MSDALCMGGSTLTLSDVSLAVGRLAGFGDPALLNGVQESVCESAIAWVDEKVQVLCERMKASSTPLPLMAVGGGAHLVPAQLAGISEGRLAAASLCGERVRSGDRRGRRVDRQGVQL